jgi:hypothetical protein
MNQTIPSKKIDLNMSIEVKDDLVIVRGDWEYLNRAIIHSERQLKEVIAQSICKHVDNLKFDFYLDNWPTMPS